MKSFREYVLSLGFRLATWTTQTQATHGQSGDTSKRELTWPALGYFGLDGDLLQGGSQRIAVLQVDAVPLQASEHFQLFVGPQGQQVNDAVAEGPLGHGVVGEALTDGVGWVDGRGALALGRYLRGGKGRFSDMDLFSL